MSYKLRFTPNAVKDIHRHKKSGDKKLLQKIEVLLEELREHPKIGTGQPAKLMTLSHKVCPSKNTCTLSHE